MKTMKMRRVQNGFTQQEIADRLGIDRTTYTKYENGTSEPSFEMLQRIAIIIRTPMEELLSEYVDPPESFFDDKNKKAAIPKDDGPREEFARLFESLTQDQQEFVIAAMRGMTQKK